MSQQGFEKLLQGEPIDNVLSYKDTRVAKRAACVECQCIMRESFMNFGGYYQLIIDGKSTYGDYMQCACKEDCNLVHYVTKIKSYENAIHDIELKWVEDKTWMLHMWHPKRKNKLEWYAKHGW